MSLNQMFEHDLKLFFDLRWNLSEVSKIISNIKALKLLSIKVIFPIKSPKMTVLNGKYWKTHIS